jgi:hypothetical protein
MGLDEFKTLQFKFALFCKVSTVHFFISTPLLSIEQLKAKATVGIDAFQLVEKDICTLSKGIKDLLGSDHPVLEACARYCMFSFLLFCCAYVDTVLNKKIFF